MTVYVQVLTDTKDYRPDGWQPWRNAKSRDEAVQLATHKFIRERGHANHDSEFDPYDLHVFAYTSADPCHKNGRPMTCHGYRMRVSKRGGA